MNLKFMQCANKRKRTIGQFIIIVKKKMDVSFSCVCAVIDNEFYCQGCLRIYSAIVLWIYSYFDNVTTKFMINNRTDA